MSASDPVNPRAAADDQVGRRAARTREAIVDAAGQLFLDRGYAGTRINNITEKCGISRAGFYTYFKDKRAVFNHIGEATYRDLLGIIGAWDRMPDPAPFDELRAWVDRYFAFLDKHGAFIFSSGLSAPTDDDFRESARRMQIRVGWLLGTALRARQKSAPTDTPETLGLAIVGMIERGWFHACAQGLPIDRDEMVSSLTAIVAAALA